MAHTLLAEIYYSGGWHTVPTYDRDEVVITRGRQNRLGRPSPSTLDVTINNRDGTYSPRNPNSPLYGLIGRNTPIRQTIDGDVRFVGEVEAWPQRWDRSGRDVWVPIRAYGIQRRLGGMGTQAPAKSTLSRWAEGQPVQPVAWWSLEDASGATSAASGLIGGLPLTYRPIGDGTVSPGATGPTGALSATELAGGNVDNGLSRLRGEQVFTFDGSSGEMVLDYWVQGSLADGPDTADAVDLFGWIVLQELGVTSGGLVQATMAMAPGLGIFSATLTVRESGGSSDDFIASAGKNLADGQPHHIRWVMVENGADLDVELWVDGVLADSTTLTTSGVPKVDSLLCYAGRWVDLDPAPDEYTFGMPVTWSHIMIWDDASVVSPYQAGLAYNGETVKERIERVTAEEGISATVTGDADQLVGPQPHDSIVAVLQHAADVDTGPLVESRDQLGLMLRSIDSIYNQAPTLTLDYQAKEIRDLEPSEDTQLIQNDVTVRNLTTGVSARSVQETGPLNVQEPVDDPHGVGRYAAAVDLNLYEDAQAAQQAGLRRWLGTQDDPRFPSITVDFDLLQLRGGSKVADAEALDLGDVLRIDNPAAWLGADHVDQIVQGYTETASLQRRVLQAYTEPYDPYRVQTLAEDDPTDGDNPGRLAGDEECAIRAAVDSDDTSIAFDPNTYPWPSNALDDTFTRTEASAWGTPDVGAAWSAVSASNASRSVDGSRAVHTITAAGGSAVDSNAVNLADGWVWALGVSPASTPTGDSVETQIYARRTGSDYSSMAIEWLTDGTAELTISKSGSDPNMDDGPVAIPGVTSSQPIDLFMSLVGNRCDVWAALAGNLDLSSGPLLSGQVALFAAGAVRVSTEGGAALSSLPLAVHYDAIHVGTPGTFPGDFPMRAKLVSSPASPTSGGEEVTISQITNTAGSFVAAGTAAHASNAAVSPGDYAGGAADDWVVVVGAARNTTATLSISDAGYTYKELARKNGLYVWAAKRTSTTPAPTITPSGGAANMTVTGRVFGFRDMPITLDLDRYVLDSVGQANASAQDIAGPALARGIIPGRLILVVGRKSDDWTSAAPPTGFTEISESTTTTGDDQSLYVAYRFDNSPAPVLPYTITVTGGASAVSDVITIALAAGKQTATISARSVNGVVKSHGAGTRLEVADPIVLAL